MEYAQNDVKKADHDVLQHNVMMDRREEAVVGKDVVMRRNGVKNGHALCFWFVMATTCWRLSSGSFTQLSTQAGCSCLDLCWQAVGLPAQAGSCAGRLSGSARVAGSTGMFSVCALATSIQLQIELLTAHTYFVCQKMAFIFR